jgi:hypothetical protein
VSAVIVDQDVITFFIEKIQILERAITGIGVAMGDDHVFLRRHRIRNISAVEQIAIKGRNRDFFFRVALVIKDQVLFLFDLPGFLHPIKMGIGDEMGAIDEQEGKRQAIKTREPKGQSPNKST